MKSFLKVIVLFLIFMVIAYSSPLINREDSTALFKSYDAKQGNLKMKVDSKETPIKYNEEKSIAQYIGKPFSLIEKNMVSLIECMQHPMNMIIMFIIRAKKGT